jgi:hypothetical protein
MGERESLEKRCVESLLVVYLLYVSLLSLIDAKRKFLCPQGANGQLAPPQYTGNYHSRGTE